MVKWSSSWLEKTDSNGVKLKLWVMKKDEEHAHCKLCSADLKYDSRFSSYDPTF